MIDLSLAGLVGAFAGTVIAALVYAPLVAVIERAYGARDPADAAFYEQERPLLRRLVLSGDILLFAGAGYWLALKLWG
ncbi:MAG: hypothetical protein ACJ8F3_18060 [Xanthobacteraceae bacterium]